MHIYNATFPSPLAINSVACSKFFCLPVWSLHIFPLHDKSSLWELRFPCPFDNLYYRLSGDFKFANTCDGLPAWLTI